MHVTKIRDDYTSGKTSRAMTISLLLLHFSEPTIARIVTTAWDERKDRMQRLDAFNLQSTRKQLDSAIVADMIDNLYLAGASTFVATFQHHTENGMPEDVAMAHTESLECIKAHRYKLAKSVASDATDKKLRMLRTLSELQDAAIDYCNLSPDVTTKAEAPTVRTCDRQCGACPSETCVCRGMTFPAESPFLDDLVDVLASTGTIEWSGCCVNCDGNDPSCELDVCIKDLAAADDVRADDVRADDQDEAYPECAGRTCLKCDDYPCGKYAPAYPECKDECDECEKVECDERITWAEIDRIDHMENDRDG